MYVDILIFPQNDLEIKKIKILTIKFSTLLLIDNISFIIGSINTEGLKGCLSLDKLLQATIP